MLMFTKPSNTDRDWGGGAEMMRETRPKREREGERARERERSKDKGGNGNCVAGNKER